MHTYFSLSLSLECFYKTIPLLLPIIIFSYKEETPSRVRLSVYLSMTLNVGSDIDYFIIFLFLSSIIKSLVNSSAPMEFM